MSRTYRRLNATHLFQYDWFSVEFDTLDAYVARMDKNLRRFFGDTAVMHHKFPGGWYSLNWHRPNRAKTRNITHQLSRLVDLEDTPEFPNGRKVKYGYW